MSNSTVSTSDASDRTIARRNKIIDRVRDVVSGGDSAAQLREEVKHLSKAERQELLHSGGFRLDVPAEQGLAMKADLGLPWNKLRIIRRQGKPQTLTTQLTSIILGGSTNGEFPSAARNARGKWPEHCLGTIWRQRLFRSLSL